MMADVFPGNPLASDEFHEYRLYAFQDYAIKYPRYFSFLNNVKKESILNLTYAQVAEPGNYVNIEEESDVEYNEIGFNPLLGD